MPRLPRRKRLTTPVQKGGNEWIGDVGSERTGAVHIESNFSASGKKSRGEGGGNCAKQFTSTPQNNDRREGETLPANNYSIIIDHSSKAKVS
jgi:hypothetical protein